MNRNTT